jgi:peptide/nickel transport system substrate-binding protein
MNLNRWISILVCLSLFLVATPWSAIQGISSMVSHAKALELLPEGTRLDTLEWTKEYIQKIAPLEIWESRDPQDAFQLVKRGDFARWLVRARLLPLQESKHQFADLNPSDPNYPYIMTALEAGIIEKTPSFHPKDPILRTDAGIWLVNTHGDLAKKRAQEFSEPLIPAQDGYDGIPDRAMGTLSTCYSPEYQMMEYRHLALDSYRYVQAEAPLLTGEAAYSLYQLVYPPQRGGELKILIPKEPRTLFIGLDIFAPARHVTGTIYDKGLGGIDHFQTYFPTLIKRFPTKKNGLKVVHYDELGEFSHMELTFELRKDLKWSDGSPLTADDFVFGHHMLKHPSYLQGYLSLMIIWNDMLMVNKIEAIDEYTVKSTWNTPYRFINFMTPLPRKYFEEKYDYHLESYNINDPSYCIPPSEEDSLGFESEKYKEDEAFIKKCTTDELYHTQPLHAGPYRVKEWIKGEHILLEPNEHYFLGKPLMDKIQFKAMESREDVIDSMIKSEFDLSLHEVLFDEVDKLQGSNEEIAIHISPSYEWNYIILNVDHEVFQDKRVRHALIYSLNREKLIKDIFKGKIEVAHTWIQPFHAANDITKIIKYEYDKDKAMQLLDEAGWKINPVTGIREKEGKALQITFISSVDKQLQEIMQKFLSSNWRDIGIDVIIRKEERNDLKSILSTRNFDGPTAVFYEWYADLYMLHSSEIPSRENYFSRDNFSGFQNKEVDELLEKLYYTIDHIDANNLMQTIQTIVTHELPMIPLYYCPKITVAHSRLNGYKPTDSISADTWNAAYWYWKSNEVSTLSPQISVKPEKLNFFEVARGINSMQKITISNVGANLLTGSINTDSPCITFDTREFSVEPQQTQEIQITLHPDKIEQAGPWGSTIEITSNDPDRPKLTLPTEATLLSPKLKLSLESIDFGTLRKSDPPLQKLDISNEGGESLELSLSSPYPALQLSESQVSIPPRESKSIQIKLDLSLIESYGAFEGTLNIQSNDPEQAQVIIPFKGSYGVVIELQVGQNKATLNGKDISLGGPSFIYQGRTMVPFRIIAEAFGASVEYNAAAQREIKISLDLMCIRLWINNPKAFIEPIPPSKEPVKEITLDVPPLIRNARSFVPLRFISETFGAKVEWEASTQTITIYFKP